MYHSICGFFFDPKFVYFLNQKSFLTSAVSFVSSKRGMINSECHKDERMCAGCEAPTAMQPL